MHRVFIADNGSDTHKQDLKHIDFWPRFLVQSKFKLSDYTVF